MLEKEYKGEYQNFENQLSDDDIKDAIATITGNKLDVDNIKPIRYENTDDPILEEMQHQSQID